MYVDYVRVFAKDGFTAPAAPELDIDEVTIGQNIEPSLAQHAIKDSFYDLGNASVISYGGGGEPVVSASELAVDGDSSLMYNFPGGSWGGAYILLDTVADLSAYSNIHFSLNLPGNIVDAEIKLESPATNAAIFLINYTGTDVGEGFTEFVVPLADFEGLDLTEISIPFAVWNPKDADGVITDGVVLIDNVYFSE
jgi:hypothetical protein